MTHDDAMRLFTLVREGAVLPRDAAGLMGRALSSGRSLDDLLAELHPLMIDPPAPGSADEAAEALRVQSGE